MTTQRNDKNFGGRYLIQDQDHMSEIRPAGEQTNTRVVRQAHLKPTSQAKRHWAAASRDVTHATTK